MLNQQEYIEKFRAIPDDNPWDIRNRAIYLCLSAYIGTYANFLDMTPKDLDSRFDMPLWDKEFCPRDAANKMIESLGLKETDYLWRSINVWEQPSGRLSVAGLRKIASEVSPNISLIRLSF